MKPKTIKSILAQAVTDYHDSALNFGLNEASDAVDTALAQIQQLLDECAPKKKTVKDDLASMTLQERYIDLKHEGFNQAIDQYKSNLREKLR